MPKKCLVHGFGINDADYAVQPKVNGKQVSCHVYKTWQGMIRRCYSSEWHKRYPTYVGCYVCN